MASSVLPISTDPSANRRNIETIQKSVSKTDYYLNGDYGVDRGVRFTSNSIIAGSSITTARIDNRTTSSPFGDSAVIQCLQGNDPWIGYADEILRTKTRATVELKDKTVSPRYEIGDQCWSWVFSHSGVATVSPVRHVITGKNDSLLTLTPAPPTIHDVLCWTSAGFRPTAATEGQYQFKSYDPLPPALIGKAILISDGQQIANESRGELRTVTKASPSGPTFEINSPLRQSYVTGDLLAVPVNVVENVSVKDVSFGAGTIGWSFAGKFLRNIDFTRCHFDGVVEVIQGDNIRFIDCSFRGGLKLVGVRRSQILGCNLAVVTFEEGCSDILFSDFVLNGVDPFAGFLCNQSQKCERIRLVNGLIRGVTDCPFALEGRECSVEWVAVDCPVSSAGCYLSGDKAQVRNLTSPNRSLSFQRGRDMFCQNVQAPSVNLGWPNQESSGVATGIVSPQINTHDGWVLV
jgi:hypothetical protein